jgi:NTP pyrophosphatase (non-canonical NTP hydrolase)
MSKVFIPPGRVRRGVLLDVHRERERQDAKFPAAEGGFPDELRLAILTEEVGEVAETWLEFQRRAWQGGSRWKQNLRDELVQVAAVAVRWIEALDEEAAS